MWAYNQIVEVRLDKSGQYRVQYEVQKNNKSQSFFLKFKTYPTEQQVVDGLAKKLAKLNEPPPAEIIEA